MTEMKYLCLMSSTSTHVISVMLFTDHRYPWNQIFAKPQFNAITVCWRHQVRFEPYSLWKTKGWMVSEGQKLIYQSGDETIGNNRILMNQKEYGFINVKVRLKCHTARPFSKIHRFDPFQFLCYLNHFDSIRLMMNIAVISIFLAKF